MKNQTTNPLFGLAFLAIFLTVLLASCAPSAAPATEPSAPAATDPVVVSATDQPVATDPVISSPSGATLMDERCTVCHSASRITSAAMTADEWTSTVDRMINAGADLNEEERQILIDYLVANFK